MVDIPFILNNYKTIAVYGMSHTPWKPAHYVPMYMASQGYNIIPVNPLLDDIVGIKSYHKLIDISDKIEILNVFRRSEACFEVVKEAIERKALKGDIDVIWLQQGIINNEAKKLAEENNVTFIQDKCIYVEHKYLV